MPANPQRVRAKPRISVNKLGEYLTATSPARRRRLVRDQKVPSDFAVPRYAKAWEPISKYLKSGCTDPTPIADAIAKLRGTPATSTWSAAESANTITALEHFLQVASLLPKDATYIKGANEAPFLSIS